MMNVSVAGLPLLTTQKYYPTTTTPSTVSLCHVFDHLSLMRAEGCSIRAIDEALDPWPGRRRTFHGIVFRRFSRFS